jgi:streptogramin lyase
LLSFHFLTSGLKSKFSSTASGNTPQPTAARYRVPQRWPRLLPGALLLAAPVLAPVHAQTAYFSGVVEILGGGFTNPIGTAVDPSGNVYVADASHNAVKEIPAGCASSTCVVTIGGGFGDPNGVAVDHSGNVYVADYNNFAVKKIPAGCTSSTCVVPLGGGFSYPRGVAVDAGGNVYVGDTTNNLVKEMPPGCASSTCVSTLGGSFSAPAGVAVDAGGNVYVANQTSNLVQQIPSGCASSTCVTTLGAGFHSPWGVALDIAGNVYVGDQINNAVKEIILHGVNFGTVEAESTSSALTFYFTFTAGGSGVTASALTQGAADLDFADAGTGTCDTNGTSHTYSSGDTCTVIVTFTPYFPGPRYGAVELSDAGGSIATAYIYGTARGPQLVFENNQTLQTLGGGFSFPFKAITDPNGNTYVGDQNKTP